MARTLEQILQELDPAYAGSASTYQQQIQNLPQAEANDISELNQERDKAHKSILDNARSRGLFRSGGTVGDQQIYNRDQYDPQLGKLKDSYSERRTGLLGAIAELNREKHLKAQDLFAQDQERERAAAAQRQQQAALSGLNFGGRNNGGVLGASVTADGEADMERRPDGGFNFFVMQRGKKIPISAATFSSMENVPFRSLLQTMADQGDQGAGRALGFVGDDYGYDYTKAHLGGSADARTNMDLYNALAWKPGGESAVSPTFSGSGTYNPFTTPKNRRGTPA